MSHLSRLLSRYAIAVAAMLLLFPLAGCSLFGISNVEEAPFQVVIEDGDFSVRQYASIVVVETTVNDEFENAGNRAFRKLFAYISGSNTTSTEIAMTAPVIADAVDVDEGRSIPMTAPVVSEKDDDGWRYMFVLPAEMALQDAPNPLDEDVKLSVLDVRLVAVVRYSGFWDEASMLQKTTELQAWIQQNGYTAVSTPRWAAYDPPWTIPWFRRNEVLIDIEK